MSQIGIQSSPQPILVLTSAGGIALAIARRLGTGHHIVLAHYREPTLSTSVASLREEGYIVTPQLCDVSSASDVQALAAAASALGRIAVVVNTAGVSSATSSNSIPRILQTNLMGTAYVIDAFADVANPGMSLVTVGSSSTNFASSNPEFERHAATAPTEELLQHPDLALAALERHPRAAGYAYMLSKRAGQLRTQGAVKRYGEKGARINSVSPGIILTKMAREELEGPAGERMRQGLANSAAKRWGSPLDIANAVAWLCASDSGYISGIDILVDGGTWAGNLWK